MQQFDWQGFKEGRFLARVESQKEPFFLEAKKNGIFCFMGDREKERNLFKCVHRYGDSFSVGRFEIYSVDERIVPHHECFKGLPIITAQPGG
jgi:hypothetical protein